jgi:hypothetical protein
MWTSQEGHDLHLGLAWNYPGKLSRNLRPSMNLRTCPSCHEKDGDDHTGEDSPAPAHSLGTKASSSLYRSVPMTGILSVERIGVERPAKPVRSNALLDSPWVQTGYIGNTSDREHG